MRKLLVLALLLCTVAAQAAPVAWLPNFEEASAKAKAENRDLLVFLNGSDWNAAARAYKKEVIESPALQNAIGNAFLWLEIDRLDLPTKEQEEAFKKNRNFELFIRSYPGVALLDSEGRCWLKLEAPQGGVAGLLEAIKTARLAREKRDAEMALAAKTSGAEKAGHLGRALDAVRPYALDGGKQSHKAIFDEIKKLDPQDTTGYQRRFTFNVDGFAEGQLWPLLGPKKYDEALVLIDKELNDARNDANLKQRFLAMRFKVFQAQEKLDDSLKTLQQLIAVDETSKIARLARGYIANITAPIILAEMKWKPEHLRFFFANWRVDATQHFTTPGNYEIEFKREGDRVTFRDIAVIAATPTGEKELVRVPMPAKGDVVSLSLPAPPAGAKIWLQLAARGSGWFGGYGDILVRKLP